MKEMTSLERCMAMLRNEIPDRVPVIPQSFLFSVETAGFTIGETQKDPEKMALSHIICQEKYGYDGCIIDFDDASLAEACGAKVILREREPAVVDESDPLIKDLKQVKDLEVPDPLKAGRLPIWLETTKVLNKKIGDEIFIMGRADQGPFTLACLLRGAEQFMMDLLMGDPEEIKALIDYCRKVCAAFAKAQKDAGAHSTSIGDAFASPNLISPDMFAQFAKEPEIALTKEVQDYGIPFSIHICGDTNPIFKYMVESKAKILEIDWQVDMKKAREMASPDDTVLMGNINPSNPMAFGTPQQVDEIAKKIIEDTKGEALFLSTGCALGRNTKPENVIAMVDAAKRHGTRAQLLEMKNS